MILPVNFMVTDDPERLAALLAHAPIVDEEMGNEVEESYTVAQAVTVVFHGDPDFLFHSKVLDGWTVECTWTELSRDEPMEPEE